jgi:ABC-type amino acid transport system permease subunit
MMLGRIALDVAHSEFDAADIRAMAILFTLGAYVVGGVIALAAGLIVAIAGLWRQPTFPTILAAIVVANIGCYLLVQPMVSYGPAGLLQNTVVSLVAGAIIWLIFRRSSSRP